MAGDVQIAAGVEGHALTAAGEFEPAGGDGAHQHGRERGLRGIDFVNVAAAAVHAEPAGLFADGLRHGPVAGRSRDHFPDAGRRCAGQQGRQPCPDPVRAVHGGRLDVRSTVNVGTTFTITLPVANQSSQ